MPNISLTGVNKGYGGNAIKAVSDLDLEIEDGAFMCLLGPSGCGKTTTLRMLAGLEHLTSGRISIGEKPVDSIADGIFVPPERRDMGLVFQSYALWPHLTIERNTDFGLRLRRVPKKERLERVERVMETLGIIQYRDRYPSQLSGGQQQRVALARMLAVNPKVLLLDEPLSNLDARLRLEMRAELKRIHSEFGTTIIFVTHDQWEAMTLATKIAVMHQGTLQQVGTPDDIYNRPANRFVAEFVGSPPINVVSLEKEETDSLATMVRDYVTRLHPQRPAIGSLGLRPETVQLAGSQETVPDDHFAGQARLAAVLPTGGSWIAELDCGGRTLFASFNQPVDLPVGSTVQFHVAPTAMLAFDEADHRAELGIDRSHTAASNEMAG